MRFIKRIEKNSRWKLLAKIVVTCLAVYLVTRQVDLREITRYMTEVPLYFTVASIVIYNISKILGSIRLNLFFKQEDILLSEKENLKLYYNGMFYNLFLPGGIGGDGYKGYYIHKTLNAPTRNILRSILWDRVSGAMAIVTLSLIIGCFIPWPSAFEDVKFLLVSALVFSFPAFWFSTNFLFPRYKPIFLTSFFLALVIQILQGCIVVFILLGMEISLNNMVEYIFVFFVSSLATVLPITIGGIGIRELIFINAARFTAIDQHAAVAFTVAFFLINAVSSFVGNFIKVSIQTKEKPGN